MSMGLIFNIAIFFLDTNINVKDGAQCHRKQHWTWSQKIQVVLLDLLLCNCEDLGQLRLPYLEFGDDNAAKSEEMKKS